MRPTYPKNPARGPNGEFYQAKWKSAERIETLRREGKCFRCEREGCSSSIYPLFPAVRPGSKSFNKLPPITPSVRATNGKNEGDVSGKKTLRADSHDHQIKDNIASGFCSNARKYGNGETRSEHIEVHLNSTTDNGKASTDKLSGQKIVMNTTPFIVNALVNDATMIQALVDNGCLCSGIIDESVYTELGLPCIPISPRTLETAAESGNGRTVVSSITFISLDLDGYVTPKLWLYVVPNSNHPMILGKKWLEDQDAIIHAKEQRLELRKGGGSVYGVKRWRQAFKGVARPKLATITTMTTLMKSIPVCRASLEDISKALRVKPKLTLEEAKGRLPEEVKDFAHLFADDSGAEALPKPRGHLDHAIDLRQENGKTLTPPWGPLYNMSREELLVLRKTLTDLLNKGWIRPSSSSAAAPVLFAKKPSGGLRFCVDYRGLNAITIPDRYPLPLFKETLRQLSKAKWFTKLDVKSAFHRVRMLEINRNQPWYP